MAEVVVLRHDEHRRKEGMMFPTAGSTIYRNEDGEVLGWDTPDYDPPFTAEDIDGADLESDPPEPDSLEDCIAQGLHDKDSSSADGVHWVCDYCGEPLSQALQDHINSL